MCRRFFQRNTAEIQMAVAEQEGEIKYSFYASLMFSQSIFLIFSQAAFRSYEKKSRKSQFNGLQTS
jgi:hypothetical protein